MPAKVFVDAHAAFRANTNAKVSVTTVDGDKLEVSAGGGYISLEGLPIAKLSSFIDRLLYAKLRILLASLRFGVRNPWHKFSELLPPDDVMILIHSSTDPFVVRYGRLYCGALLVYDESDARNGVSNSALSYGTAIETQTAWSHWSVAPV